LYHLYPLPFLNLFLGTIDDEIMVSGFQEPPGGGVGMAEATGAIKAGDVLVSVNEHYFSSVKFDEIINQIKQASRPLTLRFSRLDLLQAKQQIRVSEGWVLAKEPGINCLFYLF